MTNPASTIAAAGSMALLVQAAALPTADAAWVSRNLLHVLLARAPAAPGTRPTLDAMQFENCIRTARELDRAASSLDNQMIVIQDTTSRITFSRTLDGPQLPRPGLTEKGMEAEFDQRIIERAAMQQTLDRDTEAYRSQLAAYDRGVRNFDRDCAGTFRKEDLDAVKTQLKME
jgi:hypothetical protein